MGAKAIGLLWSQGKRLLQISNYPYKKGGKMSNKYNDMLVDTLRDAIVDFQETVLRISEIMEQTPEEVIRQLVNSKWDIRECLNDKDISDIVDYEEKNKN